MQIIKYPHPTLYHKSKPLRRVDEELHAIVREMFELMYAARGIGLAANQVDLPIRLFVVNLASDPNEGEEMVFINPVVSRPKGGGEAEEGCLSLPGVYGEVRRPKEVIVNAYNLSGEEISGNISGLLARCVQHELDHLDGTLFLQHLDEEDTENNAHKLLQFEADWKTARAAGEIPSDEAIAARLAEIEAKYC